MIVCGLVHAAALTGMNTNNPLRIFGGGSFNRGAEPFRTVQDAVQYSVHLIIARKHHQRTYRLIHEASYVLTFRLAIGRQSLFDLVENLFDFVLAHLLSPIIAPMIILSGRSMTGAVGVYPQVARRRKTVTGASAIDSFLELATVRLPGDAPDVPLWSDQHQRS